jgi:AbrB family looped-hinge helix DNA binding protein
VHLFLWEIFLSRFHVTAWGWGAGSRRSARDDYLAWFVVIRGAKIFDFYCYRKKLLCYRQKSWFWTCSQLGKRIVSTTAKIQHKGQVTIPTSVRRRAGLSEGDLVEFAFSDGKIVITPRTGVDRSGFPTAEGEYTAAQRRVIDSCLADGEKGPFYGPFKSGDEIAAFIRRSNATQSPPK